MQSFKLFSKFYFVWLRLEFFSLQYSSALLAFLEEPSFQHTPREGYWSSCPLVTVSAISHPTPTVGNMWFFIIHLPFNDVF